jgi:fimbrial chaperone protein
MFLRSILVGSSLLAAAAAQAAPTATFNVTATVVQACTISASDLAFGSINVVQNIEFDANTTLQVTCGEGVTYNIGLDQGTGAGGTTTTRVMTGGHGQRHHSDGGGVRCHTARPAERAVWHIHRLHCCECLLLIAVVDASSIGRSRASPGILFCVLAGLALGLFCDGAESSTVDVSPTIAEIPPGRPAVTFELRNPGEEPVTFEARPYNWTQDAAGDQLAPATDVVVVPPLFTIPPGGRQLVRIAPRARSVDHEGTYRVKFQEVPQPQPPDLVGIRTLLILNVPFVYETKNGRESVDWRATVSDAGEVQLLATNRGSRFAHFAGLELRDGTRVLLQLRGPQYVLAGAARTWNLGADPELKRGAQLTLILGTGARQQQISVSLD